MTCGTQDISGDGKLSVDDQWGLLTESKAGWYMFLGSGRSTIVEEGTSYVSNLEDNTNYTIFETVRNGLIDKDTVCVINDGSYSKVLTTDSVWSEASKIFSESRALMWTGTFNGVEDLRNMDVDFGVLPIPKYSEEQDGYYCMVNDDIYMLAIPTTVKDQHKAALVTEALAYESMFVLTPKFYDVYLDEKLLRDEQSKQMVDLLLDSKVFDLDYNCAITGFSDKIQSMVGDHKNTLASKIASVQKSAQTKIDKFIDAFGD